MEAIPEKAVKLNTTDESSALKAYTINTGMAKETYFVVFNKFLRPLATCNNTISLEKNLEKIAKEKPYSDLSVVKVEVIYTPVPIKK